MARAAWFFTVPDESTLPDRIQSLFAKAREKLGFLPKRTWTSGAARSAPARRS